MYIFSLHGLDHFTSKFPFCGHNLTYPHNYCDENPGAVTTFRFSVIYIVYFLLLALMMIGVKNSQDFRFIVQNGCWPLKVLLVGTAMVSSVFIPVGTFDHIWFFVAMTCSIIFILILIYAIIHVGHDLTDYLLVKQQEGEKWALVFFFGISIGSQIGSVTAAAVMLYTFPLCEINMSLVIGNLVFSYLAIMWSLSPCVKDFYGHGGLLYGGVLSCIVMFTTWTAISANPNKDCNPFLRRFNNFYHVFPVIALLLTLFLYVYAAYILRPLHPEDFEEAAQEQTPAPSSNLNRTASTASFGHHGGYSLRKADSKHGRASRSEIFRMKVGSRMRIFPDTFSVTTLDLKHNVLNRRFEVSRGPASTSQIFRTRVGVSRVNDDEKEHVVYFWSLGHFVCGCGVGFLLMADTYWSPPNGSEDRDFVDFTAMWFKASISVLINIFFVFTMYIPTMYGYFVEND